MSDSQQVQLITDDERYVNEATLELLRLRLEAGVRSNFLKTVTIPIGGGGVIAIIVAIVLWIPARIDGFLKEPGVQERIATNVKAHIDGYFKDPQHQEELEEKIDLQISAQIASEVADQLPAQVEPKVAEIVAEYFSQERGRLLVEEALPAALGDEAIRDMLRSNVASYLATTEGRALLVDEINRAMAPVVEGVSQRIVENQDRLVAEVEPQLLHGEAKGSHQALFDFVSPRRVQVVMASNRVLVLTKTIRPGNGYLADMIEEYLNRIHEAYGDRFQYVGIFYVEDRSDAEVLAGLIPRSRFAASFRDHKDEVMRLLNSGNATNRPSLAEVRSDLGRWFGPDSTRSITVQSEIGAVLRDAHLWPRPADSAEQVAVVDANNRLIGLTSRHRLIAGLLGE